jgi:hypothetical protein
MELTAANRHEVIRRQAVCGLWRNVIKGALETGTEILRGLW